MAIFLAGKAVCYRILAFFCYGKLHFKCESADLFEPHHLSFGGAAFFGLLFCRFIRFHNFLH